MICCWGVVGVTRGTVLATSLTKAPGTARSVGWVAKLSRPVVVPVAGVMTGPVGLRTEMSWRTLGAPGKAMRGWMMGKLAWVATRGAHPWGCWVSRREPDWYPAVRESPRKTVVVKLPAFLAWAAVRAAWGFELGPLEQATSARARRDALRRSIE